MDADGELLERRRDSSAPGSDEDEDEESSSLATCVEADEDEAADGDERAADGAAGAVGGSAEDVEEEEEERVLRELAQSPALGTVLSGLESLRSESGICSSLESNYQDGAAPEELERLETRLHQEKEAELERVRRELTRQKQLEIRRAIGSKNEEIELLRSRLQADRQRSATAATGHREVAAQSNEHDVVKLKNVIRKLEAERDELKAEAQLCRIREKQRSAELRRQKQQHEREVRRLLEQDRREGARESRDLAKLRAITEQKDKEIAEREKQIDKLEAQKCYLGEEIYRLTGIEEGFWSDQILQRASLTDRERGLVRRASHLGSQLSQLQVQCRTLKMDNEGLRTCIDSELSVPLTIRSRAVETQREAQVLKKQNQKLLNMTRKLEEKVNTLEKGAVAEQRPERTRERPVRQMPNTRAVPLEHQPSCGTAHEKTTDAGSKTARTNQRTAGVEQRTASVAQRTAAVAQRTAAVAQRTAGVTQRTASVAQRTAGAPQRAVGAVNASAGGRMLDRPTELCVRERTEGVTSQQRPTVTSQQREREAEYRRHVKDRDAEVKRLREQMKDANDQLSSRSEIQQTLKERGKKELAITIQQLQKQKADTEAELNATVKALSEQRDANEEKLKSLREENEALREQLLDLNKLIQVHTELERQFEEKVEECEQLADGLQTKEQLCNDLEKQFTKVIEKNTELTIQNSDLQRQVLELEQISTQCVSIGKSLSSVQAEYDTAQMELGNLRGKVSTLESVLKQMREAAEQKKNLERQHQEAQQELRQKQQQIQTLTKVSEEERESSEDTIQSLESKVRELERKTEAQNLRHEELMLELSSLKKQNKYKSWLDGSPDGTITPDSMLMSNESTARSTPVGTAPTPASLEALTERNETPRWSQRQTDIQMSSATTARPATASLDLDKIMAKIENDNKVLAELDRNRSTIGLSNSLANSGSATTRSTFLPPATPLSASFSQPASLPATFSGFLASLAAPGPSSLSRLPAAQTTVPFAGSAALHQLSNQLPNQLQAIYHTDKTGLVNGVVPGLMPANPAQMVMSQTNVPHIMAHQAGLTHVAAPHTNLAAMVGRPPAVPAQPAPMPGVVDVLDIPGKGKCQVHIARYSYDPFQHSPNEAPESELRLNAGDYVLVWGEMDEDGFLDGETLQGRRGLVPSNFVQKLVGEDLLEFHRQVVAGLRDCDRISVSTSLPQDLDFNSADEALLGGVDEFGQSVSTVNYGYEPSVFSDEDDQEFGAGGTLGTVPPPRQLTLERQLNKSVVISWTPADAPPGAVDCYHVYVDGLLRTTARAPDLTRALIEGVDLSRPHRVSVRSVTPARRTSRDAACTMLIGRDVPLAPTAVRATNVSATSAVISWMPSNSNHQHSVCVNSVEVRTVKPGVHRHTITGISPNTVYRASVKVKIIAAPHFGNASTSARERLETHIEFRTLPQGVPDPPVDVQCELGPQEGSVLVTWLPVTINSTSGTSNGAPVTGYAVYADGKKVTELDSPTGDHALISLLQVHGFSPRQVTVRTKSRDLVSVDSVPADIPQRNTRKEDVARMRSQAEPPGSTQSSPRSRRRVPPTVATPRGTQNNHQQVLETEENLSDKEVYYGNSYSSVPQIEITRESSAGGRPAGPSDDDYGGGGGPWPRRRRPAETAGDPAARLPAAPRHRDTRERRRGDECADAARSRHNDNGVVYRSGSNAAGSRRASAREDRPRIFVALFDYDPPSMSPNPDGCDEELPFREGQLIKIHGDKDGDGFFWGETSRRAGYVPCNMVSEVQVDDDRMAQDMLHEEGRQSVRARPGGGGGRPRGQEDRWGDIYTSTPVRRMVALYDYDPQELSPNVDAEVELSFSTGDIINVYGDMDDDGFYIGDVNGVRGLVPSNFLTDPPQPNHDRRRGQDASADRRAPPGPGVHGPPLPPRDKGDSRDRRKDCRGDEPDRAGDRGDSERKHQRW